MVVKKYAHFIVISCTGRHLGLNPDPVTSCPWSGVLLIASASSVLANRVAWRADCGSLMPQPIWSIYLWPMPQSTQERWMP